MAATDEALKIRVNDAHEISSLLSVPEDPRACFVMAHGAGSAMVHPFMAAVAAGLAERGVATLRYNFPYMEAGSRRVDRPELAQAAVRAAVAEAAQRFPGMALVAGGKSFGGRMTSQAEAAEPLPGVLGLAFFGFPLHPAGKPSAARGDHLDAVRIPMLFLQGSRDALAELPLLQPVVARLGSRATLYLIEDADHSFHVPARSGRKDPEVLGEALDAFAAWLDAIR